MLDGARGVEPDVDDAGTAVTGSLQGRPCDARSAGLLAQLFQLGHVEDVQRLALATHDAVTRELCDRITSANLSSAD